MNASFSNSICINYLIAHLGKNKLQILNTCADNSAQPVLLYVLYRSMPTELHVFVYSSRALNKAVGFFCRSVKDVKEIKKTIPKALKKGGKGKKGEKIKQGTKGRKGKNGKTEKKGNKRKNGKQGKNGKKGKKGKKGQKKKKKKGTPSSKTSSSPEAGPEDPFSSIWPWQVMFKGMP
jgi:hypothetical protein